MRIAGNARILVLLVGLSLAAPGWLGAQGQPELWTGKHWRDLTEANKVAYIKGIGNLADYEVAAAGRLGPPCLSQAFVKELQGKPLIAIVREVDAFYQNHPDQLAVPVIEVVLRRFTTLCAPDLHKPPAKGK